MHQLSSQDAQFLYIETENNLSSVMGVNIFDPSTAPGGKVRFKDIIDHVESRLFTSFLYTHKLARVPFELDYPYWVEDKYFDIEYHIRHGRLPEPGDWRQFCIHLARYHSRPLNLNRPPWEMYVIEGLDRIEGFPEGAYAIATKVHHAAVDGTSATRFFAAMSDIDPYGTPTMNLDEFEYKRERTPTLPEMLGRAWWHSVRSPFQVTDAVLRAAPSVYRAVQSRANAAQSRRHNVPDTRFNTKLSPHRMFGATFFELTDFKAIKKLVPGATINDVVLAVCSGALRKYLDYHNELPDDSLVAWVPINARPKDADPESIEDASNNISAMTAAIHTDIEDPLERLTAIVETTQDSKEAKSGISARLMTDLTRHVPAATQVLAARLVLTAAQNARVCNLFVSNVPGPQVPLYMNGAQVVANFGLAPLADGMGLFIATPSYNGRMSFGVTSTREIMPDMDFFIACLEESANELLALTISKPKAKKKRVAK